VVSLFPLEARLAEVFRRRVLRFSGRNPLKFQHLVIESSMTKINACIEGLKRMSKPGTRVCGQGRIAVCARVSVWPS
jgi:hypothetical protein